MFALQFQWFHTTCTKPQGYEQQLSNYMFNNPHLCWWNGFTALLGLQAHAACDRDMSNVPFLFLSGCEPYKSRGGWRIHLQCFMSQDKLQGCPGERQDTVMFLERNQCQHSCLNLFPLKCFPCRCFLQTRLSCSVWHSASYCMVQFIYTFWRLLSSNLFRPLGSWWLGRRSANTSYYSLK